MSEQKAVPEISKECGLCEGTGEVLTVNHGDQPCPECCSREHKEAIAALTAENTRLRSQADTERGLRAASEQENDRLREERDAARKLAEASERWRLAYQEGKEKLYAMGGEVAEAAITHLPCNEGGIDRLSRQVFLYPQLTEAQAENTRLRNAILWADGQNEDFRERQEGEGAYWWRKELMQRARLTPPAGEKEGR